MICSVHLYRVLASDICPVFYLPPSSWVEVKIKTAGLWAAAAQLFAWYLQLVEIIVAVDWPLAKCVWEGDAGSVEQHKGAEQWFSHQWSCLLSSVLSLVIWFYSAESKNLVWHPFSWERSGTGTERSKFDFSASFWTSSANAHWVNMIASHMWHLRLSHVKVHRDDKLLSLVTISENWGTREKQNQTHF